MEFYYSEDLGKTYKPLPGSPGWCSVFDKPGEYLGYTAVGPEDEAFGRLDKWLEMLGVPQSGGYYIVSPAYWNTASFPVAQYRPIPKPVAPDPGSECLKLPVSVVQDPTGLDQGDTVQDPKCFKNGDASDPGFVAGGYDSSGNGWRWSCTQSAWGGNPAAEGRPPIQLTKDYISLMWQARETTWAQIKFSYRYNLVAVGVAKDASGKDTYVATFYNESPFTVRGATLRAYVVQDGKWQLVASTRTDIGPLPRSDGQGNFLPVYIAPSYGPGVTGGPPQSIDSNVIKWTFEVPPPAGEYRLAVSVNLAFTESGTMVPEPMVTVPAYRNTTYGEPLTGTKMEVACDPYVAQIHGRSASDPYADNWVEQGFVGVTPPPGGGGGGELKRDDLAVTGVQVLDAATGQPVSSPQPAQNLKVRASFASSFDVGGWAKIRLYKYQAEFGRLDEVRSESVYFEPRGACTREWDIGNVGTGQYKFIATIDLYNTGNDPSTGWKPEKFDGKYEESTYDNNKREAGVTGTEGTPREPSPVQRSQSVWYPPLTWKERPIYEEYTEPVYGWKKVPFSREKVEEGKPAVRLVE
ncbi:hypothetical protein DXX99_07960 [Ammonifex thiophilus]|uniref:Uncharacterized protein n=1 Tax=Ammonifex thiophilus TaxID=444093 RepID=A0A3D8P404_9THEO|nr:hypothetical protein DXX99_07960 [Ammonifex thiophilus]